MSKPAKAEILFEDDSLLVVNKPAGLLSIPGRDGNEMSLVQIFGVHRELFVVHRLDRDTSGAIVFAKNEDAHRMMSAQFEAREVHKTYLAIVVGRPVEQTFLVDARLYVDDKGKAGVSSSGKKAETQFRVLELFSRFSLIEAIPFTGRQHQIRIHLAHAGHPLAVDPLYGSSAALTIAEIKRGARVKVSEDTVSALLTRTPLHATRLEFIHPVLGSPCICEAPLPKDMQATLSQLRKWSR